VKCILVLIFLQSLLVIIDPIKIQRKQSDALNLHSLNMCIPRLGVTTYRQRLLERTVFLMCPTAEDSPTRWECVALFFYLRCILLGAFHKVRLLETNERVLEEARTGDVALYVYRYGGDQHLPANTWKPSGLWHVADEHRTDDVSIYGRYDFVLRNYWRPGVQGNISSSNVLWVPLGFVTPSGCAPEMTDQLRDQLLATFSPECKCNGSLLPASQRKYLWNFVGSIRRNREKMVDSLRHLCLNDSSSCGEGHLYEARGFGGDGRAGDDSDPRHQLYAIFYQSVFTLAPCGWTMETHRIWDALAAGSIPIFEECEDVGDEWIKEYKFLSVRHADEFPHLLQVLAQMSPSALDQLQSSILIRIERLLAGISNDVSSLVMRTVQSV